MIITRQQAAEQLDDEQWVRYETDMTVELPDEEEAERLYTEGQRVVRRTSGVYEVRAGRLREQTALHKLRPVGTPAVAVWSGIRQGVLQACMRLDGEPLIEFRRHGSGTEKWTEYRCRIAYCVLARLGDEIRAIGYSVAVPRQGYVPEVRISAHWLPGMNRWLVRQGCPVRALDAALSEAARIAEAHHGALPKRFTHR